MIVSKIYGGLGNQLFQYCLGRHLAIKNQCDLKLDLTYFKKENSWPFQLDFYKVNYQGVIEEEALAGMMAGNAWWKKFLLPAKRLVAKDKNKAFQPDVLKYKAPCIIDGYWQSDKYFKAIAPTIQEELTLKPEFLSDVYDELLAKIKTGTYVSLHVRRGDYVKVGAPLASISYYEAAIEEMTRLVEEPNFLVFSDDIAWVKENLRIEAPVMWMENSLALEDFETLQLMSQCKHHIIGNSTYSWWGAWLNQRMEKIVIYPRLARKHLNRDLMPSDWREI